MREPVAGSARCCHPASVYIVIVNWNRWWHTLTCLESLLRLRTSGAHIVVCDNGSEDGSPEHISAWASGRLDVLPDAGMPGVPPGMLSHPPVPKPIAHRFVDDVSVFAADDRPRLVVIRARTNLGFGAGCNLGIRYALAQRDCQLVWLLNNDTAVDPDALDALLQRFADPTMGLCGSTLLHYDAPERIQCQGGARFYRAASLSRLIGKGRPLHRAIPCDRVERALDHVYGASMLVSRAFLEGVGPLPEYYFLYYEEMDWTLRGNHLWRLGYAERSLVYHRKGASAGTGSRREGREARARYQLASSRLRFTRLHTPWALPIVVGLLLCETLWHGLLGRRPQAGALLWALRDAARASDPTPREPRATAHAARNRRRFFSRAPLNGRDDASRSIAGKATRSG